MKVAIYVRVSTEEQSYEQQVSPCIKFCELKNWNEYAIFKEVESTRKVRPIFNQMIERAKRGEFKYIVVFRLDRAYRSSRQFIMDFDMLKSRGIYVISVTEGLDPSTPMGECMSTILVALAQLERTNISVATKERLDALKKSGKVLGRPKGSKDEHKRRTVGYDNRWKDKLEREKQSKRISNLIKVNKGGTNS